MLTLAQIGGSTSHLLASNLDTLVAQFKANERKPADNWDAKRTTLNARLSVLSTIKTKLQNLSNTVSDLGGVGSTSALSAFTATSSNSTVVSASASSTATPGSHSILVTQLAKSDLVFSDRLLSTGTTASDAAGAGTWKFSIAVNGVSKEISVGVVEGDSNSSLLTKIATAVNGASAGVSATVVGDTATTKKLVFTGSTSGSTNAVTLQDVSGTLLDSIGLSGDVLSGRTASTSTEAGYATSDVNGLDSRFNLDGVDIVRGTNSVTDVLSGVTLNLSGTQLVTDQPVTLKVASDKSAIKSEINQFISDFNGALSYLNSKTSIDPQTHVGQILAGDTVFNGLRYDLRGIVAGHVKGLNSGDPSMLQDIGIKIGSDGTLSLDDSSKLDAALENGPSKVAALFNSTNGLAVTLKSKLDGFTKFAGVMDSETNSVTTQVTILTKRITDFNARLAVRADQFRTEFANLLASLTAMQEQQSFLSTLIG